MGLSAAEIRLAKRLARSSADRRLAERARFALLGATGRHTLDELAARIGRQRSTIQGWLSKFAAGGLPGLLDRQPPPGVASPISRDAIERELKAGLSSGRWTSAADIAGWLQAQHGIRRSRKSIYYWLRKWEFAAPGAHAHLGARPDLQASSGKPASG